ncbi:MAG: hypothetical protein ACFE85_01105 [Candidatus Hodarchaeota archaeon]
MFIYISYPPIIPFPVEIFNVPLGIYTLIGSGILGLVAGIFNIRQFQSQIDSY